MAHPIYKTNDIEKITQYHHKPDNWKDALALKIIKLFRGTFDLFTRFNPETMNERHWLDRVIYLETVAGVPGMIGGM